MASYSLMICINKDKNQALNEYTETLDKERAELVNTFLSSTSMFHIGFDTSFLAEWRQVTLNDTVTDLITYLMNHVPEDLIRIICIEEVSKTTEYDYGTYTPIHFRYDIFKYINLQES